jgi:hypothetical protein
MQRLRGATVARLTPDQKVACSNHVGVKSSVFIFKNILFRKVVPRKRLDHVTVHQALIALLCTYFGKLFHENALITLLSIRLLSL